MEASLSVFQFSFPHQNGFTTSVSVGLFYNVNDECSHGELTEQRCEDRQKMQSKETLLFPFIPEAKH